MNKKHEPKRTFILPVNNISREEAELKIKKLLEEYHKDIEFPEGVVININSNNDIDHTRDIWFPRKNSNGCE